jgi:hypothetical protein
MRKWRLPLTYQPKVEPVLLGTCRQTIRVLTVNKKTGKLKPRKQVGDLIRFFLWTGRPYWSKQIDLTEYEPLNGVIGIRIFNEGIYLPGGYPPVPVMPGRSHYFQSGRWLWEDLDWLAALDSIVPPTGEALRDVLIGKNGKIPPEGIEAQILRW